jgi:hypothetical protein
MRKYSNSLGNALSVAYPEHPWKPWNFGAVPAGFWDNKVAMDANIFP